jgi:hypothetical protein
LPDEAGLGFQRVYVANPDRPYAAAGSIVPEMILPIPIALRIVKMNDPMTGGFSYAVQGWGKDPAIAHSGEDWATIRNGISDPRVAIAACTGGQQVPFVLGTPVIDLRCPKCAHEFQQQAEYLPVNGQTTCPSCSHSEATEEFNAINSPF